MFSKYIGSINSHSGSSCLYDAINPFPFLKVRYRHKNVMPLFTNEYSDVANYIQFAYSRINTTVKCCVTASLGTLVKGEKYFMRIDYYKKDVGVASFSVKKMMNSSFDYFKKLETRTTPKG